MSQTELESAVGEVLIDKEALSARIAELGAEIGPADPILWELEERM